MPTWEQLTSFVTTDGLAVTIVLFVMVGGVAAFGTVTSLVMFAGRVIWNWAKPRMDAEFAKRCTMYEAVTKSCTQAPVAHKRVMRGQGHLGSMILSETELEKRVHFDQLQSEIDDADED